MKRTDLDSLDYPRLLYKGRDDQGALPAPHAATPIDQVLRHAQETDRLAREELERQEDPTQTCRVNSREELDEKLSEGWRLHRTLDTAEVSDAEANRAEAADVAEEATATRQSVEAVAQARDAKHDSKAVGKKK